MRRDNALLDSDLGIRDLDLFDELDLRPSPLTRAEPTPRDWMGRAPSPLHALSDYPEFYPLRDDWSRGPLIY